jgi:hypothetical protein
LPTIPEYTKRSGSIQPERKVEIYKRLPGRQYSSLAELLDLEPHQPWSEPIKLDRF